MLLEFRYLCFFSWEKVAVEMDYDLRYLHKLHGNWQSVRLLFRLGDKIKGAYLCDMRPDG